GLHRGPRPLSLSLGIVVQITKKRFFPLAQSTLSSTRSATRCPHCESDFDVVRHDAWHLHTGMATRVPGPFRPEPEEAQCVDLFECDHCHKRFVIQHEDGEPVTLPRRKRKHP